MANTAVVGERNDNDELGMGHGITAKAGHAGERPVLLNGIDHGEGLARRNRITAQHGDKGLAKPHVLHVGRHVPSAAKQSRPQPLVDVAGNAARLAAKKGTERACARVGRQSHQLHLGTRQWLEQRREAQVVATDAKAEAPVRHARVGVEPEPQSLAKDTDRVRRPRVRTAAALAHERLRKLLARVENGNRVVALRCAPRVKLDREKDGTGEEERALDLRSGSIRMLAFRNARGRRHVLAIAVVLLLRDRRGRRACLRPRPRSHRTASLLTLDARKCRTHVHDAVRSRLGVRATLTLAERTQNTRRLLEYQSIAARIRMPPVRDGIWQEDGDKGTRDGSTAGRLDGGFGSREEQVKEE